MLGVGIGIGGGSGAAARNVALKAIAGATSAVAKLTRQLPGSAFSIISGAANAEADGTLDLTGAALTEGGQLVLIAKEAIGSLPYIVYQVTLTGVVLPGTLGPTTAAFATSSTAGTTITTVTGLATGETITAISPNDGRLAIASGRNIVVGLTASSAGTTSYTLTTSTGRSFAMAVTASAVTPLTRASDLVMHFAADDLALADGAAVATWSDAYGNTASQPTAGNRPTYKASVANMGGKPGVLCNGANLPLGRPAALTAAIDSQNYTLLVVASNVGSTGYGCVFGALNGGSGPLLTATGSRAGFRTSVDGTRGYPWTSTSMMVLGAASTTATSYTGSGHARYFLNGTVYVGEGGAALATDGSTGFAIGAASASNGIGCNAIVHRIVAWKRILTPAEIIQVQAWACDLYGQAKPWAGLSSFDVFDGDSLTDGYAADAPEYSYPSLCEQALGRPLGSWTITAIPGVPMTANDNNAPTTVDTIAAATGKPTRLAVFNFANQYFDSNATLNSRTYLQHRRSAGITKIAFGTSTDITAYFGSSSVAQQNAYDSYWDTAANRTGLMDAYVPIHNNALIGAPGAQAANPSYFAADKLHLSGKASGTASGYGTLAGLFTTALQAIG